MHQAVIRAALLLAAAATLSTTAAAQGAQQLPPPVKAWLAEQAAECRAARGRFSVSPDFLTPADFNGDGVPDYVVSVGGLDCETASGMGPFAYGSAGPSNDFLISGPRGHRRIEGFSGTVGRGNIQRRGNRDVIVAERGASQPHLPTKAVWGWNGTTMALLELRNARGQVVDENGRVASGSSGAAAVLQSPPAQAAASPTGFVVTVELSPAAQQWYARRKDRPVLEVIYQGPPKRGTPADHISPPEGVVVAGEERVPLPPAGGTVRVPGAGIDPDMARWIQGEPEVGLLVTHARPPQSSMDSASYLECTPAANPKLSAIRARGARLRCGPPAF